MNTTPPPAPCKDSPPSPIPHCPQIPAQARPSRRLEPTKIFEERMKKPLEGRLSDHGKGLGTVTREMVMVRAREIAVLNGRSEKNVLDSDFSEARRELLGEDEIN